jgi:hypothetical protein
MNRSSRVQAVLPDAGLHRPPALADLRGTAAVFNGFTNADASWLRLVADTAPGPDPGRADHRALLHRWLNTWGCRIRYPHPGEPAPFEEGVAAWWHACQTALPETSLARLTDAGVDAAAESYASLAQVCVSAGGAARTLGPTAAAKLLYALRPAAIMPWDAAIAIRMYGARDGAAFGRHLRLGRSWARAVIAETGADETTLPGLIGRPAISLAKILDEHLYVTITLAARASGADRAGTAGRALEE